MARPKTSLLITVGFVLLAVALGGFVAYRCLSSKTEWTIMIYMNSDARNINTMEFAALCTFYDIAQVGSQRQMNIVVQFARPGQIKGPTIDCRNGATRVPAPEWSGMLRFLVRPGMAPSLENALEPLSTNTNMADSEVFRKFVCWAMRKYPARHYALIFFNHGDGSSVGKPAGGQLDSNIVAQQFIQSQLDLRVNSKLEKDIIDYHSQHDHPLQSAICNDRFCLRRPPIIHR